MKSSIRKWICGKYLTALAEVLQRAEMFESHQVELEKLSTRERMTKVLDTLQGEQFVPFVSLRANWAWWSLSLPLWS